MTVDTTEDGLKATVREASGQPKLHVGESAKTEEDIRSISDLSTSLDDLARKPKLSAGNSDQSLNYPSHKVLPTTLADHMTFPDARREIDDLASSLCLVFTPMEDREGYEFTLPWDDTEAAKELREVSDRFRRFSDWIDAKLEGYVACSEQVTEAFTPIASPFRYTVGSHEMIGYVDIVGGVCRVQSDDVWDTFVVEEDKELDDVFCPLLEDLYIHRASLGRDPYDF